MSFALTREAFDAIVEATGNDLEGASLRADYSGRGMYGRSCLALVVPDVSGLVRWTFILMDIAQNEYDDVAEQIAGLLDAMRDYRTRADSMGHGVVYYWPEISVEPQRVDGIDEMLDLLQPNGNV